MGRIIWGVVVLLVLSGLYLFLAGTVDLVELVAMAVCAAAGTALAIALEMVAKRNYAPLPPPRAIFKPLAVLLPELFIVGRELIRVALTGATGQRGAFVQQPFTPGGDEPRAAARRAITIIGVSLAPRTFVIRGERTDKLLLHSLPQKAASSDTAWPA